MESARQKLLSQVEKHPFWSNKAARRMHLTAVENRQILLYELSSFSEKRDIEWRYEPYRGGLVQSIPFRKVHVPYAPCERPPARLATSLASGRRDSVCSQSSRTPASPCHSFEPANYDDSVEYEPLTSLHRRDEPSAELLWSLEPFARPKACFESCISYCQVPNSSFVKRCHCCSGRGRLKCNSCHGVGYEVCISCSGKGTMRSLASSSSALSAGSASHVDRREIASDNSCDSPFGGGASSSGRRCMDNSASWQVEPCSYCRGSGQKRCWICAGRSYNTCQACAGAGQLRCYMRLIVTWLTHRDEQIINNSDNVIPRDRLKLSIGKTLLDETRDEVSLSLLFPFLFSFSPFFSPTNMRCNS